MGRFRAASLRNIELTAPYMHDGSMSTLEAVLDFYAEGGRNMGNGLYAGDGRLNPYKDPLIAQIRLDAQDKADLVAFLKTLTDTRLVTDPRFADPFAARP
jgi:cytochrome c peroxidase